MAWIIADASQSEKGCAEHHLRDQTHGEHGPPVRVTRSGGPVLEDSHGGNRLHDVSDTSYDAVQCVDVVPRTLRQASHRVDVVPVPRARQEAPGAPFRRGLPPKGSLIAMPEESRSCMRGESIRATLSLAPSRSVDYEIRDQLASVVKLERVVSPFPQAPIDCQLAVGKSRMDQGSGCWRHRVAPCLKIWMQIAMHDASVRCAEETPKRRRGLHRTMRLPERPPSHRG